MGRAYPTKWQTTPVVFAERKTIFCPITMCDGNGNTVHMTQATSDLKVERVFRAGLSQLGSHVGCAEGPVTGGEYIGQCPLSTADKTYSGDETLGRRTHHLPLLAHRPSGSKSPSEQPSRYRRRVHYRSSRRQRVRQSPLQRKNHRGRANLANGPRIRRSDNRSQRRQLLG